MVDGSAGDRASDSVWERWHEVDRLFEAALDVAPDERAAFLRNACGRDDELLHRVLELVEIERAPPRRLPEPGGALLRAAWGEPPPIEVDAVEPGVHVGRYRLVRELGRGGMATVYEAERADGSFRQRVAIKVLRRGIDRDDVVRRFLAERQILSGLEHPHIARLIDGGATVDGQPYLVMECVAGDPITRYADRNRLSIRQRLALFLQVADAVQFAHRRLIVHRDLKPSNVLVDEAGNVKLLDFGIAKLLDPAEALESELVTRTGVRPLTPAYASPEQLRGERVTTASDVYQLGALLYELLAGRRPFAGRGAELEAAITTGRVVRPSDASAQATADAPADSPPRVGTIAASRATTPDGLQRALRGDLDAIVLAALRTEPERRYESAGALADDLHRYLARQPVHARPDSWGYRARRFATRHPAAVALALVALVLAGAYVVTLNRHAERLAVERDRARTESAKAQQLSSFLMALFRANDPDASAGVAPSAFDLLERGEQRADALAAQPAVQAQILDVIAQMYVELGLYGRAEPLFRRALRMRRTLHAQPHGDLAGTLDRLGDVLQRTGRYDEAAPLLRESARMARLLGDSALEADATTDLGHTLIARGDYRGSEEAYRSALAIRRALLGDRHERTATSLHNLALALEEQQRFDEAERLYVEALETKRALLDPEHSSIALTLTTLGRLRNKKGEYDRSEPLLRQALEIGRSRLGPRHERLALTLNELGLIATRRGEFETAEGFFRESLAINEATLGPDHQEVATGLNNVSYVLIEQGRLDAALPLRRRALDIARRAVGSGHQKTGLFAHNLALLLDRLGRRAESESLYREAISILERTLPDGDPLVTRSMVGLGDLLTRTGRAAEAEALLRSALQRRQAAQEPAAAVAEAESLLGACLAVLGRAAEAEPLLERGHTALEQALGPEAALTRAARARLAAFRGTTNRSP